MNLKQWQERPGWSEYEASLIERGYLPYWDEALAEKIQVAGITCCRCGGVPTYVGMTDGTTALGFLACGPDCGEWIWFLASAASTRP